MAAVVIGYRVTEADPAWRAEDFEAALQKGVAIFAKGQSIATQTAWDTFVAGLTAGQSLAVMKQILATVKCSVP